MTTSLAIPEASAFEKKALAALAQANAMTVTSEPEFQAAAVYVQGLKAYQKELDSTFDEAIAAAHASHKAIVAAKKKHYEPIAQAETVVKAKLITFQQEMERKQREEQRRLEEEARKRAEDEILAEAHAAERSGDKSAAEAILASPVAPLAVVAPKLTPTVSGASFRDSYGAEVVDLMALVKAVAVGKVPLGAIEANLTFINANARIHKATLNYPGVKVVVKKVMSSRSA